MLAVKHLGGTDILLYERAETGSTHEQAHRSSETLIQEITSQMCWNTRHQGVTQQIAYIALAMQLANIDIILQVN
jgi:hypothetical protein